MDYKEKYEQALSKARQFSENPLLEDSAGIVEYIFPELKESEDEKVRKEIIDFATKANNGVTSILANNYDFNKWLAWLEKQGEQKPILDVEIPFGAEDSELQEVFYDTPNGFHAEIKGNKVVIKKGEQNPAWSEEDEEHIESILKRLDGMCKQCATFTETCFAVNQDMAWLKSIKSRTHDL